MTKQLTPAEEREEDFYWSHEDFERSIEEGIITCFESKIRHNEGAHPQDRISKGHLEFIRNKGLWFFSQTRIVLANDKLQIMPMDIMPEGTWSIGGREKSPGQYDGYNITFMFRRIHAAPGGWRQRVSGNLYEGAYVVAKNNGVTGERWFFTVASNGTISHCKNLKIPGNLPRNELELTSSLEVEHCQWPMFAMQYTSDSRHTWVITAQEHKAKVNLCCAREEVKSLLYARSLPLTATGRKRPILHLVAAHRRRIKEGVEVDVNEFLRGQRVVEMNGTRFSVRPPEKYLEGEK